MKLVLGELRTFGTFSLKLGGNRVSNLHQLLLVLRLLLEGKQRRPELADLLWPAVKGRKDKQGREYLNTRSLNTTLYQLNRLLPDGHTLFLHDHRYNIVRLKDETLISCDAVTFKCHFSRGEYRQAVALYKGTFLEGFEKAFDTGRYRRHYRKANDLLEWLVQERKAFRRKYWLANAALVLQASRANTDRFPDGLIDPDYSTFFPYGLELLTASGTFGLTELAGEGLAALRDLASEAGTKSDDAWRFLSAMRLLRRVAPGLGLQARLRVLYAALESPNGELELLLEELRLAGWLDEDNIPTTPTLIDHWLEQHQAVEHELLRALALASPRGGDYHVTTRLFQALYLEQGFENEKQLFTARAAYKEEAAEQLQKAAYDKVQQLLEPLWRQELLLSEGKHDPEVAFLLAYAYERDGKFRRGLDVLGGVDEERLAEDGLALKAALLFRVGEYAAAEVLLGDLESGLRPDSWASAQVLNVRGNLAFARKRYREALVHFQKAELKWRFLDGNRRVGELANIGVVYDWMGGDTLTAADDAFARALEVADEVKANSIEKLRVLYNWSVCLIEHGRLKDALELERDAEQLISGVNECGEYLPEAFRVHYLVTLGISLQEQGEHEKARERFERASRLAASSSNLALQGQALFHLGEIERDIDELVYALELLEYSGSFKDLAEYQVKCDQLKRIWSEE